MSQSPSQQPDSQQPDPPAPKLPLSTPESMWRRVAKCRGMDPNLFFYKRGERIPKSIADLCDACPAQECCRKYGAKHRLLGVWGGKARSTRTKGTT